MCEPVHRDKISYQQMAVLLFVQINTDKIVWVL